MKPVDSVELSALLDGELPSERADEVRRALAEDLSLRQEYEELARLDAHLKAQGEAAVFPPRISLAGRPFAHRFRLVPAVFALLAFRFILKAVPIPAAVGLELLALVFFLGWALQELIAASDQECDRLHPDAATTLT